MTNRTIAQNLSELAETAEVAAEHVYDGDLPAALATLQVADEKAHHARRLIVKAMRERNRPWSDVAEALGMTKQSAHRRFRDLDTP